MIGELREQTRQALLGRMRSWRDQGHELDDRHPYLAARAPPGVRIVVIESAPLNGRMLAFAGTVDGEAIIVIPARVAGAINALLRIAGDGSRFAAAVDALLRHEQAHLGADAVHLGAEHDAEAAAVVRELLHAAAGVRAEAAPVAARGLTRPDALAPEGQPGRRMRVADWDPATLRGWAAGSSRDALPGVLAAQGMDGPPVLVTAAEWPDLLAAGNEPMYRGIHAENPQDALDHAEQFRSSARPHDGWGATMGPSGATGSNFDTNPGFAEGVADRSQRLMPLFNPFGSTPRGRQPSSGVVLTGYLRRDAVVLSLSEALDRRRADAAAARRQGSPEVAALLADLGVWAALSGIDAIVTPIRQVDRYYLVVNRAAMLVETAQPRLERRADAYVGGDTRHFGTYGAAGLLVTYRDADGVRWVLLQQRSTAVRHPGTWGLIGGAREPRETARAAAMREGWQQARLTQADYDVPDSHRHTAGDDRTGWSYTTVLAQTRGPVTPTAGRKSTQLRWVRLDHLHHLPLHPGFADTWPAARAALLGPGPGTDGADDTGQARAGARTGALGPPTEVDHRLSEEENERIFRERIVPERLVGATAQDIPEVIFLVAQSGSGKSTAKRTLFGHRDGLLDVDTDRYRVYHPDYGRWMRENDVLMSARTEADRKAWAARTHAWVLAHRVSLVFETAGHRPEEFTELARTYRAGGYRVTVVMLGVAEAVSRQGGLARYYDQVARSGHGRLANAAVGGPGGRRGYLGVAAIARAIDTERLADRVWLYRRGESYPRHHDRLAGPADAPGSGWRSGTSLAAALQRERTRALSWSEARAFRATQRWLRQVARPEHQPLLDAYDELARPILPREPGTAGSAGPGHGGALADHPLDEGEHRALGRWLDENEPALRTPGQAGLRLPRGPPGSPRVRIAPDAGPVSALIAFGWTARGLVVLPRARATRLAAWYAADPVAAARWWRRALRHEQEFHLGAYPEHTGARHDADAKPIAAEFLTAAPDTEPKSEPLAGEQARGLWTDGSDHPRDRKPDRGDAAGIGPGGGAAAVEEFHSERASPSNETPTRAGRRRPHVVAISHRPRGPPVAPINRTPRGAAHTVIEPAPRGYRRGSGTAPRPTRRRSPVRLAGPGVPTNPHAAVRDRRTPGGKPWNTHARTRSRSSDPPVSPRAPNRGRPVMAPTGGPSETRRLGSAASPAAPRRSSSSRAPTPSGCATAAGRIAGRPATCASAPAPGMTSRPSAEPGRSPARPATSAPAPRVAPLTGPGTRDVAPRRHRRGPRSGIDRVRSAPAHRSPRPPAVSRFAAGMAAAPAPPRRPPWLASDRLTPRPAEEAPP